MNSMILVSFLLQAATIADAAWTRLDPGVSPRLARFHDLNGDGAIDRLTVDTDGRIRIALSTGSHACMDVPQELPPVSARAVLVEDLDLDGVPDLLFVTEHETVALRGLGEGFFEPQADAFGLLDLGPGLGVEAIDLDGDGWRDIVLRNVQDDIVYWREADGSFTRERLGDAGAANAFVPTGWPSMAALPITTQLVPAGAVLPFAGPNAPQGFLICDGSAVSPAAYPRLFAEIGTIYGGDGVDTFNLPNLRQRFPLGVSGAGTGSTLGAIGGTIDHVHGVAAHQHQVAVNSHEHGLNAHTHSLNNHTHTVPGHAHSTQHAAADIRINSDTSCQHPHGIGGLHNSSPSTPNSGSNRFMIGVGGTGDTITAGTGSTPGAAGDHAHSHASFAGWVGNSSVNGDNGTMTTAPATGSTGGPSTGTTSGHPAFNTDLGGGGNTSPQNPPFIALNFIIKT